MRDKNAQRIAKVSTLMMKLGHLSEFSLLHIFQFAKENITEDYMKLETESKAQNWSGYR